MQSRRIGVGLTLSLLIGLAGCAGSSAQSAPPAEPTHATTAGSQQAPAPEPTTASAMDAGTATPGSTAMPAGSATPPAHTETAASSAPMPAMPTGIHGPAHPWAQMNPQARGRYMAEAVLPAMTSLLHEYDPTQFATVTCATCHGANAREVHFRMPNTLPALHAPGTPAGQEQMARNGRMIQFMRERMVPVMAQLIGEPPFNMQTHQGFGCFECHSRATD